ncbi:helix-turn-helix domain-containing protein [Olivibacter domesticus]|uniref:AraC-like ligand binding domain-containing protein n=1 Tax=Olivibacter domesticus TaxID=407022 RepID=A0A1H7PVF6_OLID1|nr:helix-turn-helix domain-containing protein [Olivibacter domesticus]SEL39057.1 AraC-like ligand binding domain-containing protein [Olivibacter domesticus]
MKKKSAQVNSHHLSEDDSREFMVFHINKRLLNSKEFKPYNIFNPFRSDFFAIIMVHEGAIEVNVNLQNFRLKKNDLLAFAPNTIKHLVSISDDCKFYAILYKSSFLINANIREFHQNVYDSLVSGMPLFNLAGNEAKILGNLIEVMWLRNHGNELNFSNDPVVKHGFLSFLYAYTFLHRKYRKDGDRKTSRKEDLMLRFINLVANNFKEERSVDYYAKKLFITPKYLSEVTKDVSGKTASSIIAEMVIMEAKSLLNISSLSVIEISDLLNFSDMSFFGKYFKRYTGTSPTTFRKQIS